MDTTTKPIHPRISRLAGDIVFYTSLNRAKYKEELAEHVAMMIAKVFEDLQESKNDTK